MKQLFSNNAISLLVQSISSTSTELQIIPNTAELFPNPGPNEFFIVTLENQQATLREIVQVVARNGNVLTVNRGIEGTTARDWSVNTLVDLRWTAGAIVHVQNSYNDEFTIDLNTGIITTTADFEPRSTRLYLGGLRQKLGIDYTEIDSSHIQLLFPYTQEDIDDGQHITLDYGRIYPANGYFG